MRALRVVPALVAAVFAVGMLSCDNPIAVQRQLSLAWLTPPPDALREGDSATVTVELHDASGQPVADFDGATVELHFAFQSGDSLPGTACGAACTTTVSQGRAGLTVAWMSAGTWAASACIHSSAGTDTLCAQRSVEVLAVRPVLVTYPADSVGRRARFPVEARLRLSNGTAVTDQARTVRLRFTSAAPAAGHARCPEAGPLCERAAVAGVVRLDSVMVLDTAATTLTVCAIAPNGQERCDPAGPRTFRVVVPQVTLHFVTEPAGGAAGSPFTTQPVVEALEPDGTRRTDFTGLVDLALDARALAGPVLAGTGAGGTAVRGTVTVRAAAGLVTLTDLRVNRVGSAFALVASAAGAVPDTSAVFDVPLVAELLQFFQLAGGDQHYLAGGVLPIAPTVLVAGSYWGDDGDAPIAGVVVNFAPTAGSGRVAAAVDTTDLTGTATSGAWTLGPDEGTQYLVAAIAGLAEREFLAYSLVPAEIVVAGQPTDVPAGDTIRPPVMVVIQDWEGTRVIGATDSVFLRAYQCAVFYEGDPNCGDRGEEVTNRFLGTTARAAVDGRAVFDDLVFTQVGTMVLLASVRSGLSDQSLKFSVSGGSPAALVIVAGNNQNATAGTAVSTAPSVRVFDAYGNEVHRAGVPVTFAATMGGGSVIGGAQATDADGIAHAGAWTLGPTPGMNALSAKAVGLADSVVFFAIGTAAPFNVASVSAGWDFTCATALTTNLPYCWGANTFSQLGEGTQTARSRPTLLAGGLLQLTKVSGGGRFACGLTANGAAYCWGANDWGQLGIDAADVTMHATPEPVVGGQTFQQIATGFAHACALAADGGVWCWGAPSEGSLGVADPNGFAHPQHVSSLLRFTQIAAGGTSSCALADSGDIWCWGNNAYGQLGNNSTDARSYAPVKVTGGRSFTQVTVGTFHACGVSAGAVYCWGRNQQGQLGTGSTTPAAVLEPVAATGALGITRQVAAGNVHTCAVNGTGETYCWGDNTNGQLGDLSTTQRPSGVQVLTDVRFVAITAGLLHTCALTESGATFCWGSNGSGRLGIGTAGGNNMTVPVAVVVP
jgi:alpha-tubulin suppressor-like RCC1 family protein